MPKLGIPKPPDPRPSKAHPEHRAVRKELEKKHGGYEWMTGAILALSGLAVAFNIERDVKKCEERKERPERERQGQRAGGDTRRRSEDRRGGERSSRRDEPDRRRGYTRSMDRDRPPRYMDDGVDWERDRRDRRDREFLGGYDPWSRMESLRRPGRW